MRSVLAILPKLQFADNPNFFVGHVPIRQTATIFVKLYRMLRNQIIKAVLDNKYDKPP